MIRWAIAGALLMLIPAAGVYYWYFYPPIIRERAVEKVLNDFSAVVATRDREKIGTAFQELLTPNARIRLDVKIYSIAHVTGYPMMQDFDKATFIAFIDNIIFTLDEYAYTPELREFRLLSYPSRGDVEFTSNDTALGEDYQGGVSIHMRFNTTTSCAGQVQFTGEKVALDNAVCTVELRSLPKAEDAYKLQNADPSQLLR